jgi:hypothetical protein
MSVPQQPGDWESAAVQLRKEVLDLSAQCLAFRKMFEELAEMDAQFCSVAIGRFLEHYHAELTRQMVIYEGTVGAARAAEFDSWRSTPEMDLLLLKTI